MKIPLSNLWVGAFIKTSALVVYDPKLQIDGNEWVNLYSVNQDSVRAFERDIVREKIRPARHTEHEHACNSYAKWAKKDNGEFVAEELLAKARSDKRSISESLQNEEQSRISRHKEFLSKLGKIGEARVVESTKHRATNCYSCKCCISSDSNLECTSCGWLICQCGACGCGFSR